MWCYSIGVFASFVCLNFILDCEFEEVENW